MFSQVCVKNSVHRGCAWLGHAWQGVHGRGTCMAVGVHGGGVHGRVYVCVCVAGGHAWQGGVHGREVCMVGGVHVWRGGGMRGKGGTP